MVASPEHGRHEPGTTARSTDRMMPWPQANTLAREIARPLPGRTTPVVQAGGQVLAETIAGVRPVPAFDTAAMDGFAVSGGGPWTITGLLLAGGYDTLPSLSSGEAVEIATGAPVPPGTTAVLPYEESTVGAGTVSGVIRGRIHIRRTGETLAVGAQVAPAGRIVTATLAAAAVQAGVDDVVTHRPPAVTLLVTGDEVISDGTPGPGQVRDSFTGLVTAITTRAGGVLTASRHQPDDPATLAEALTSAGTDVIVVSGSSSAGAADHLHTLLTERSATWHVRGVACRPGHPQALAELPDGRWVVSLPGNPFAGLVAALTLLEPLLETLAGRPPKPYPTAPITGTAKLTPDAARIVPVTWTGESASIIPGSGPAGLHAAASADALAVLPATWTPSTPAHLLLLP
ncbi:molybdopterin molybdotransferase MoeA [Actinoplanes sp. CA-015351]|uniref:molybdopterin molybdotransferase MoeA n=1 Tax=Actinoplanes sp. CA-015351 TaxID=3239897 RepID=UPI003D99A1CB